MYKLCQKSTFLSLSFPTNARGQNLFESIKNEPFSIPEDDGNDLTHTFFNPNREGWLLKLGKGGVALAPLTPRLPASHHKSAPGAYRHLLSAVLRSRLLRRAEADTCC